MHFIMILVLGIASLARAQEFKIDSTNLRELVYEQSAKVQAARKNKEAAEEKQGHLVRSFLPSLDLHASQEQFKSGTADTKSQPAYGAELRMNLFNGGRDGLEDKYQELTSQKKGYESERILAEELDEARSRYWQILYLRDKQEAIKSSLESNRQNLAAADRRIRSGVATESDRVEFEMKDVELRQDFENSQIEMQNNIRRLGLIVGKEKISLNSFAEKLDHEHDYEGQLKHSSKDHDFLLKENEIQAEQSRLLAKKERRVWWPKLEAFAGYNQYSERDKDSANASDRTESVIGLRVSLSIAAGLESYKEGKSLAKAAEAAEALAQFQKKEIEVHLESEMAELKLLHNQVHEVEENIRRAEKYYRLTQSEYGRGVKNSPDVLGASEKLFETRHKRLEIIRDFQLAKSHVLSKIGK